MNTKLLHFYCLILISLFSIIGCKKDTDNSENLDDFGTGYYWITDYSDSWTDIFLGLNGNSILCKKEENSQNYSAIVSSILVDGKFVNSTIILNTLGLPQSISINDYNLVFSYASGNNISMSIINSTGLISSIRDIQCNINFSSLENSSNLWQDLSLTKSVAELFNNQLTNKINSVAGNLSLTMNEFEKIIELKGTSGYKTTQMTEYLEKIDLVTLISNAEECYNVDLKSENIDKAAKLLAIKITTESASEVTNKDAKIGAQSYLVDLAVKLNSTFSYKLGIRYCDESGDPTKAGTEVSETANYKTDDIGSTNNYSSKLTGLTQQKKYKYCAFIQYVDFVDFGEIKTFEPVYVKIDSWQQTGSANGSFSHDGKSYNYEFYVSQVNYLSGDVDFISEWGIYSKLMNKYYSDSSINAGSFTWTWTYWSTSSSASDTQTPYVKFENGDYYMGDPVNISLSYGNVKSVSINGNVSSEGSSTCVPYRVN
jgi:hypothetical protein